MIDRLRTRYPWILVSIIVVVLNAGATRGVFHYDDHHSVVRNQALSDLSLIPAFFQDPALFSADPGRGMYRPVLLTTYAINRAVLGSEPFSFLVGNLLIHAANAALVTLIALHWLSSARAMFAGLLFGLHPVITEPVNYVSARSDSLVALFLLLTIVWATHSKLEGGEAGGGLALRWKRCRTTLSGGLALLTKSTAIAAWPMLVLVNWTRAAAAPLSLHPQRVDSNSMAQVPGHRYFSQILSAQWGVLAASGAYLLLIWFNGFLPQSLSQPSTPLTERFLTQTTAWIHYLHTLIMPIALSPEPQLLSATSLSATVLLSGALIASMLFVGVLLSRRHLSGPWALMLWFGFSLVPVSLAPLNVLVNDRRLYLPMAGMAIASVVALTLLKHAKWRVALGIVGLSILAVMNTQRSQIWSSEISLWTDAAAKGPMMPRAQLYLGDALLEESRSSPGRLADSRAAYERVLSLNPTQQVLTFQAHNGLALVDRALGNTEKERARLEHLVAEVPDYVDAWVNLGNAWYSAVRLGQVEAPAQALEAYDRALQLNPDRHEAALGRGAILQFTGRLDEAEAAYRSIMTTVLASKAAMNLASLHMLRARIASDPESRLDNWRTARSLFLSAAEGGEGTAMGGVRAAEDSLATMLGSRRPGNGQ